MAFGLANGPGVTAGLMLRNNFLTTDSCLRGSGLAEAPGVVSKPEGASGTKHREP